MSWDFAKLVILALFSCSFLEFGDFSVWVCRFDGFDILGLGFDV